MKVFISADIEGVAGTMLRSECVWTEDDYKKYASIMTKEVVAACNGAINAGADEVVVKDAHGFGNNIDIEELPYNVRIIRNFNGNPYSMIEGIDNTFDAIIFIGYHSCAGNGGNPLSHTITGNTNYIKINGQLASEFFIFSYAAAYLGVPSVFLSGDKNICEEAVKLCPEIKTVANKEGRGASVESITPMKSCELICKEVEKTLKSYVPKLNYSIQNEYKVEICYKDHKKAYAMSFYPGAKLIEDTIIEFNTNDYFDVLRMLKFVL